MLDFLILGIMCQGLSRFFPGASEVTVSDLGVRLAYPGGKVDSLQWNDRRSRLVLYDFDAHPRMIKDGRAFAVLVPYGRSTLVTKECLSGILAKAREKYARITSYNGNASWYGFSPIIYRIRGGPPATHPV